MIPFWKTSSCFPGW